MSRSAAATGMSRRGLTPASAAMFGRAMISSFAATVDDGLAYQIVVRLWPGHYGIAALSGAVVGAITNFLLNRYWAFHSLETALWRQALRYAVGSALTFLALRGLLWLFIEQLAVSERWSWFPAKALAFLLVSYPLQKIWVFRRGAA